MSLNLKEWGPVTVLAVAIVVLAAVAGGVVVIVNPSTLTFSDYLSHLQVFAVAIAGVGVGRGLHLGLAAPSPAAAAASPWKWGPTTVVVVALTVVVASVGAFVVIVNPATLTFSDYLGKLQEFVVALAAISVGRGLHLGLASPRRR